jgi:hypothetical protein
MAGTAQCRSQEGAHGIIIFSQQDLGHLGPPSSVR